MHVWQILVHHRGESCSGAPSHQNAIYNSRSSRMTLHYQSIPHADNACSNNLKKTAVDSVGHTCSNNAKLFHLATGLDLRSFDVTRAHAMLALDNQRCTLSFMCLRFLRHIQRRWWNCGSSLHFSPNCDRPREGDSKGGKGEGKTAKILKKEEVVKKDKIDKKEAEGSWEVMRGLLEEANKMLKAMSSSTGGSVEETSKEQRLTRLQQQLDELKVIKVFKISKVAIWSEEGLLDSGAIH